MEEFHIGKSMLPVTNIHGHIMPYHMMKPSALELITCGRKDIADKVLWGTEWPSPGVATLQGGLKKFHALPIGAEAKRKILYDNAARLFPC